MRWPIKPAPERGDIRKLWGFAWLPTKVQDHRIWLEVFYYVQERTERITYEEFISRGKTTYEWTTIRKELYDPQEM
jgi:hypothetical protein